MKTTELNHTDTFEAVEGEVYVEDGTLNVRVPKTPRYKKNATIHDMYILNGELYIKYTEHKWVNLWGDKFMNDELDIYEDVDKVLPEYVESGHVLFIERWNWRKLKRISTPQIVKSKIKLGWVQLKDEPPKEARTPLYIIHEDKQA